MNALSINHLSILLLIIITSIISCSKYLNIIQITSFNPIKLNHISQSNISINPMISNIIAILTMFIILSFLKPIYLISLFTYLI